jgi:hypothetical protein
VAPDGVGTAEPFAGALSELLGETFEHRPDDRVDIVELPVEDCSGDPRLLHDLSDVEPPGTTFVEQRRRCRDHPFSRLLTREPHPTGHPPWGSSAGLRGGGDDAAPIPPTFLITGTRDMLLVATVRTHIKICQAGAVADILVYEGVSHRDCAAEAASAESQHACAELNAFLLRHLQLL